MTADHLPPGLAQLFPPPDEQPPPEVARQIEIERWYREQSARIEAEARTQMLTWQAIFCTCSPRYTRARPSNRKCVIHAGFMITPSGQVL